MLGYTKRDTVPYLDDGMIIPKARPVHEQMEELMERALLELEEQEEKAEKEDVAMMEHSSPMSASSSSSFF